MGKKALLFIWVYWTLFLFISCSGKKEENVHQKQNAGDVRLVENDNQPRHPNLSWTFKETLSITEEGWWPSRILVDDRFIYVLVSSKKENQIKKYSHDGIEVASKKFSQGSGPGDFQWMDPCLSGDGILNILDTSQRRITRMNDRFDILDIRKIKFWGDIFRMDSLGNLCLLTIKILPEIPSQNGLVLMRYTAEGKALHEIHEYLWGPAYDPVKMKYSDELFRSQIKFKIDRDDNILYAMTDQYEIACVSPEGKRIRTILKKGKSRRVTQKDIDRYMPADTGRSKTSTDYNIPDHMPCIADLFCLEGGGLLVVTFENESDSPTLAADVFDADGIFSARIQIPRYYRWDFLLAPGKNNAVYKNGRFYTLEADENEENFFVKRYEVLRDGASRGPASKQ